MDKADFVHAYAKGADFRESSARRANFFEAHIEMTKFRSAAIESANFFKAHLNEANFNKAQVAGAYFRSAFGLSLNQIRISKGWEKAKYDSAFAKELGLSKDEAADGEMEPGGSADGD